MVPGFSTSYTVTAQRNGWPTGSDTLTVVSLPMAILVASVAWPVAPEYFSEPSWVNPVGTSADTEPALAGTVAPTAEATAINASPAFGVQASVNVSDFAGATAAEFACVTHFTTASAAGTAALVTACAISRDEATGTSPFVGVPGNATDPPPPHAATNATPAKRKAHRPHPWMLPITEQQSASERAKLR